MSNYRMYRVSMAYIKGSPWELLAQSEEHAELTVRKFYPQTQNVKLVTTEVTLEGDPITLVHALSFGESFHTILHTDSGKPAMRGSKYIRGDFDPTRNQYRCHEIGKAEPIFLDPYTKIIKLED